MQDYNCLYKYKNFEIPIYKLNTLVIGSGCAGLNAADWLCDLDVCDIALATEGFNMGTSRNTGSDKQTYYKLSMSSGEEDGIGKMAKTLFDGKSVNGDTALCEAAGSAKSFMKLAILGVPFPHKRIRRICRIYDRPRCLQKGNVGRAFNVKIYDRGARKKRSVQRYKNFRQCADCALNL